MPVREPAALDWTLFPWPEAISVFARGLGAARLGLLADARVAGERLSVLETNARQSGEELFARNIRVLRLEVESWIAQQDGDPAVAIELMQAAADLETATPKHAVTPAPTLPAYDLLGDLQLAQGRSSKALEAYRQSLALYPNRAYSKRGAERALLATRP